MEAVFGCEGSGTSGINYCGLALPVTASPTITPAPTPTPRIELGELVLEDECPPEGCPVCTGNCNDDSDCMEGLECFERTGLTSVPGCTSAGVYGVNYCYATDDSYVPPTLDPPNSTDSTGFYFYHELTTPQSCELYAADPNETVSVAYSGDTGIGAGSTLFGTATYIYVVDTSGSTNDNKVGACG